MIKNGYRISYDIGLMVLVNIVYMAVLALVGTYGYNFIMTMCRYDLPVLFTLKCYMMLLIWEVCVALVIVDISALISTFMLKLSPRNLRMLFPACITLIPLSLNLWICHLGLEGYYISFSYHYRYILIGIMLVMLTLLFGRIGSYAGPLCYAENDNTQDSL